VHTEGPFHKYKAARLAQGYVCLRGMDGDIFATYLTLYLLTAVLSPNCNLRCKAQKDQRTVCWQTCFSLWGRESGRLCEQGDELASSLKCGEALD